MDKCLDEYLDTLHDQDILKSLDISAYQTFSYQMHISGYVWKYLSLQGYRCVPEEQAKVELGDGWSGQAVSSLMF